MFLFKKETKNDNSTNFKDSSTDSADNGDKGSVNSEDDDLF